jgi:thiamine-phosphate pyrophosphorylase
LARRVDPQATRMSAISTAVDGSLQDRLGGVRLYLIASFDGRPTAEVLRAAGLAGAAGAGAVQVRLKAGDSAARRALLVAARDVLPPGTLLLVNDDLDAVFDTGGEPLADGVHLGREDAAALAGRGGPAGTVVGLALARARLGPGLLLGTSTRNRDELGAALAAGADHAGFGAMGRSATKRDTSPAEPTELRACVEAHPEVPLFAIGGLEPATLHDVTSAGCRRVAVGSAILDASDPAAATAAVLAALRG